MTHICFRKLTITGSDNGLSPSRRQAIISNNARILIIVPLGTNFIEISSKIHIFSFKKMYLKMSSGKWQPFCLSLNVLRGNGSILLDCYTIHVRWLLACQWSPIGWLGSHDGNFHHFSKATDSPLQWCWELFSAVGPSNVFMKFQWVPAVHTCLKMFNVTQKDARLVPVNITALAQP